MQAVCSPEGLQGAATVITLPLGITFSPVPSALTFRVLSSGTMLTAPTNFTLSGYSRTYIIEVSPGGDITDIGLN
jgi:hypothetical protein